ncbi:MAG: nucleotidyltransferase family protein [Planctomycetia bacterium]|nr:nucleotidyltransferase family protein [Planctomycetia bacterium]
MEIIEERLRRATRALEKAGIPYAVVGGNAVRIWVAQIDQGAVRATNDVDILIRPADLGRVQQAMLDAGFSYRQTAGVDMFVENENDSPRNAVHVVLSGQMVKPDDFEPNPDVEPCVQDKEMRTLTLESLVRMKVNSFRLKDKVHLLDMIQVGLIDASWPERFPGELRQRLQSLIDNPNQ